MSRYERHESVPATLNSRVVEDVQGLLDQAVGDITRQKLDEAGFNIKLQILQDLRLNGSDFGVKHQIALLKQLNRLLKKEAPYLTYLPDTAFGDCLRFNLPQTRVTIAVLNRFIRKVNQRNYDLGLPIQVSSVSTSVHTYIRAGIVSVKAGLQDESTVLTRPGEDVTLLESRFELIQGSVTASNNPFLIRPAAPPFDTVPLLDSTRDFVVKLHLWQQVVFYIPEIIKFVKCLARKEVYDVEAYNC